jgi:hypothetical protein
LNANDEKNPSRAFGDVAAVAATGFLSGWSAVGTTAGVTMAVALGGGAFGAVFPHERRDRRSLLRQADKPRR